MHADVPFFYNHAPTPETAKGVSLQEWQFQRMDQAIGLADAEEWGRNAGLHFSWSQHGGCGSTAWRCVAFRHGEDNDWPCKEGIEFVRPGNPSTDPFSRVVEAQLALTIMEAECNS